MTQAFRKSVRSLIGVIVVVASSIFHPLEALSNEEKVRSIASSIIVKIELSNSETKKGTGVIIGRKGDTYTVLTSWHVVDTPGDYIIQTLGDNKQYIVRSNAIKKIGTMDLAEIEFTSNKLYGTAKLGNANRIKIYEPIYVSGCLNPAPSIRERTCYTVSGSFIQHYPAQYDGYSMGYNLNNSIGDGMSGGAVQDKDGFLIGINGLAIKDMRTRTVALIGGIPINEYAKVKGLTIPSILLTKKTPQAKVSPLHIQYRLYIYNDDIDAEIKRLSKKIYYLDRYDADEQKIRENLSTIYQEIEVLDDKIETMRQLIYQNDSKIDAKVFSSLTTSVSQFKGQAANYRGTLDTLSIKVGYKNKNF